MSESNMSITLCVSHDWEGKGGCPYCRQNEIDEVKKT